MIACVVSGVGFFFFISDMYYAANWFLVQYGMGKRLGSIGKGKLGMVWLGPMTCCPHEYSDFTCYVSISHP